MPKVKYRRAALLTSLAIGVAVVGLSCKSESSTGLARFGRPAAMLKVAGDTQSAVVGTQLPSPLVAEVVDSSGNPVPRQIVNFVVVAGGGKVFAGVNTTNDSGVARELWTLGTSTADSQRLEARAVDNVTGAPLTFAVFRATALPGPPAKLAFAVQPSAVVAGVPISPALRVTVQDVYGNTVTGTTSSVTLAITTGTGTTGALLGGTVTVAAVNGVVTFSTLTVDKAGTGYTLTASAAGMTNATSAAFAVAAGPAAKLAFGVQPTSVLAGAPLSPAVQVAVQDAQGNPVTSATTSVTVAIETNPAGGTLSGTMTVAAVSGVATFSNLRLDSPGTGYALRATASGLTGATSAAFNVTAFAAVSAAMEHTCGLTSGGAAYCWGDNTYGGLGDGDTIHSYVPVAVSGGFTFAALSDGELHSCGVRNGTSTYCWGDNRYGQLGNGSSTASATPVAVSGPTFASVSSGDFHSCALTPAGAAYCWGANTFGMIGDGTQSSTVSQGTPVAVSGGLTFTSLSAGGYHSCGVASGGMAYCWGRNTFAELGDTSTTGSSCGVTPSGNAYCSTPMVVSGGTTFAAVSAGEYHTCGLTAGGAAYCWGSNHNGQLGNGDTTGSSTPLAVSGGLTFTSVSAGGFHSCGLTPGGAAYCWGYGGMGQLGGSITGSGCGVTSNGAYYCSTPVPVSGGLTFATISAGLYHTCGVTTSGVAYCWGFNYYGQLGIGSTNSSGVPVRVFGP